MSRLISFIGGGGKTTTIKYLAEQFAKAGEKVIITTTTHIQRPSFFMDIGYAHELKNFAWTNNPLWIGRSEGRKLSSIRIAEVEKLIYYADVVLVEADGAKMHPIKVPAGHEPVLPQGTDTAVICMGVDAVGLPASKVCFRYNIARKLYHWDDNHILSEADAARILTDRKAGLKNINDDIRVMYLINKADNDIRLKTAYIIRNHILDICRVRNISCDVDIVSYKNKFYPSCIKYL